MTNRYLKSMSVTSALLLFANMCEIVSRRLAEWVWDTKTGYGNFSITFFSIDLGSTSLSR